MPGGEGQREGRACPGRAGHAHLPVVLAHDIRDITEPEAVAFHVMPVMAGYTEEVFENLVVIRGFDADAAVSHVDMDGAVVSYQPHLDLGRLRTVLERVLEEVVEYPAHVRAIAADDEVVAFGLERHLRVPVVKLHLHVVQDV